MRGEPENGLFSGQALAENVFVDLAKIYERDAYTVKYALNLGKPKMTEPETYNNEISRVTR